MILKFDFNFVNLFLDFGWKFILAGNTRHVMGSTGLWGEIPNFEIEVKKNIQKYMVTRFLAPFQSSLSYFLIRYNKLILDAPNVN